MTAFPSPLSRATDPSTSQDAAATTDALVQRHETLILTALHVLTDGTPEAIAVVANLLTHQVGKRLVALARRGAIVWTGETRRQSTGRSARVWRKA